MNPEARDHKSLSPLARTKLESFTWADEGRSGAECNEAFADSDCLKSLSFRASASKFPVGRSGHRPGGAWTNKDRRTERRQTTKFPEARNHQRPSKSYD